MSPGMTIFSSGNDNAAGDQQADGLTNFKTVLTNFRSYSIFLLARDAGNSHSHADAIVA